MLTLTINGESKSLPAPCSVADLLASLGRDPKRVAVEVNEDVVPSIRHREHQLKSGDHIEIVTLVGGGSSPPADKPLVVGKFRFNSRLITGTGKYASFDLMRASLDASACEVTTVAVRRERLIDKEGRNILDYLDLKKLTILPNTAGCFSAEDAIRHARLARELLTNLGNPGADWVKLEVLGDTKTLLPDPVGTLKATEQLVKEGLQVLVYTSDDPILAKHLKAAGATSVMPAGSPIGSGQGILNPNNLRIILEYLKDGDPDYPVIVDAGVGTASDVTVAMELGCDGVLLNTGIAHAKDPVRMAWAMRYACESGRLAYLSGRIPQTVRDGVESVGGTDRAERDVMPFFGTIPYFEVFAMRTGAMIIGLLILVAPASAAPAPFPVPRRPNPLRYLALYRAAEAYHREAEKLKQQLLVEKIPTSIRAAMQGEIATLLRQAAERYAQAAEYVRDARSAEAELMAGRLWFKTGEYARALDVYKALARNSRDVRVRMQALGGVTSCLAALDRASELAPWFRLIRKELPGLDEAERTAWERWLAASDPK